MLPQLAKFYAYGDWPYGNTPTSTALNMANIVCGDSKNDDTAQKLLERMCSLAWEMERWDLLPETRAKVEKIRDTVSGPIPF